MPNFLFVYHYQFKLMFSLVKCHVSHVTGHMSCFTCHMWHVMSQVIFFLIGWANWWSGCYQRGLLRLVFINFHNSALHWMFSFASSIQNIFLSLASCENCLCFSLVTWWKTCQIFPAKHVSLFTVNIQGHVKMSYRYIIAWKENILALCE